MSSRSAPIRVSVVATEESTVTPVIGLFETFAAVGPLTAEGERDPAGAQPFEPEIVAHEAGQVRAPSGLTIDAQRSVADVSATDVVIVPSMALRPDGGWVPGRYPRIVTWIRQMYEGGAMVCSACTGALLVAETGLLDGSEMTIHWSNEAWFRERHPEIGLRMDEVLVVSGEQGRLVSSGAASAWHDLALYIVARYVGPATAQALARFQLLQWHRDGQKAFAVFQPPTGHGDSAVLAAQRWIADNYAVAAPVEEMAAQSGLSPRTLARRFRAASGYTPLSYVQRIRVEEAKRRLESGGEAIEEISWKVGYEDPAAFRRLFKRTTGLTPGDYRRRFRLPALPRVRPAPARSG